MRAYARVYIFKLSLQGLFFYKYRPFDGPIGKEIGEAREFVVDDAERYVAGVKFRFFIYDDGILHARR